MPRPFRASRLTATCPLLAFLVVACGGPESSGTGPGQNATLDIVVATTGVDPDPDGYLVSVNDGPAEKIPVNGSHVFEVPAGPQRVRLASLSSNCSPDGQAERAVVAPARKRVQLSYSVTCRIRQVAFSSDRSGTYQVYLMDRDGANVRRLTSNTATETATAWSPDGSRLLVGSDIAGNRDVFVIDADGANRRQLTSTPGYDGAASWSPDGQRIAFRSDRDGNSEIYVMSADGSNQTRLTRTADVSEDAPRWSPDGSKIVFQATDSGDSEILVMNADGSGVRSLTDNAVEDLHPSWSPDGTRIVFVSQPGTLGDPTRPWELFVMNGDGSARRQLTSAGAFTLVPQWAPDGLTIACTVLAGTYRLRLVNADGTAVRDLPSSGRNDYLAVWRP